MGMDQRSKSVDSYRKFNSVKEFGIWRPYLATADHGPPGYKSHPNSGRIRTMRCDMEHATIIGIFGQLLFPSRRLAAQILSSCQF